MEVDLAGKGWENTPGALEWLGTVARQAKVSTSMKGHRRESLSLLHSNSSRFCEKKRPSGSF
jgi:hypothetical protein